MSKILVLGTGPLYSPDATQFCGQSLRTWHLTKPLRDAGHVVELVVIPTEGFVPDFEEEAQSRRFETFNYTFLRSHAPDAVLPYLEKAMGEKTYDALLGINPYSGYLLSQLPTTLPLWVDLMGHPMGEAQSKCRAHSDDQYLAHYWSRQRVILRRGDRFSASSHKQMYATLGELSTLGRLNQHTCATPFATMIPVTADEMFLNMDLQFAEKQFRGPVFPEDAFAVLWTGGYNTWTDIKALAAALSLAMEQNPRLRFISTGGIIPGHDEITYPSFLEEMRRTGFLDRCHFLGWIEGEKLPHLYAECDLGLNLDALNYETLFGGRNRLTNLMAAGVPILTTLGTELSEIVAENRLGYTARIGKVQDYADLMHRAFKNPLERRQLASRARNYCRENFAPEAVTRALLKWAAEPQRAGDNEEKLRLNPNLVNPRDMALSSLEEEVMFLELDGRGQLERLQQELAELRGSRFVKMRDKFHSLKKAVKE